MSVVRSIVKAKSMALKSKTSAIKTRLIILSLLKNKKVQLTAAISHKLHALIGNNNDQDKIINDDDDREDQISNSKAIVVYNYEDENSSASIELVAMGGTDDVDDKYPDLTHSLFDSDAEEEEESGTSVIDLVRNSKENAQDFSLEDDIDEVADLFIKRFHRRIKLQKLESFKSYQQMLQRGL
ncbi:hypothetical protein Scep_018369 [Stephania cephalantha]|uniref:Uncharacterized protein n=1 Tax=Stephania cephalantha TaxID=152367 RepID=A0AAP0IRD0_9MAGN